MDLGEPIREGEILIPEELPAPVEVPAEEELVEA